MDMRPLSERWGVWKSAALGGPVFGMLFVLIRPELQTVPRAVVSVMAACVLMAAGRAITIGRDRRRETWTPPPPFSRSS